MNDQLAPGHLPGAPDAAGLICAECTHDAHDENDRARWCSCADGQQCRGPCHQRAHTPAACPFGTAYVPHPVPWQLVQAGDVIRFTDGRLATVDDAISPEAGGYGAFPGEEARWTLQLINPPGAPITVHSADPERPVPVLVPYAERAALVALRDLNPTMIERAT